MYCGSIIPLTEPPTKLPFTSGEPTGASANVVPALLEMRLYVTESGPPLTRGVSGFVVAALLKTEFATITPAPALIPPPMPAAVVDLFAVKSAVKYFGIAERVESGTALGLR